MQGGFTVRRDPGQRRAAMTATAVVHAAVIALLLSGGPPQPLAEPDRPILSLFDVAPPPAPPPRPVPSPPITAQPVKREAMVVRPTAGGGSPRPAPAPPAEQASAAAVTPAHLDRVDLPAPAADLSADVALRVGTAVSDGRDAGIASGVGTGGRGKGTGNGDGDGDGPGQGRLRFALAEWIEKPPQRMIDEVFPKSAFSRRISGVAVLLCVVPQPGRPKTCAIAAERPRKYGFGDAALALYPQFRIRPVMKGDQVVQAEVYVPVTFTVHK